MNPLMQFLAITGGRRVTWVTVRKRVMINGVPMLSVGRWDTETEPTGKPEDMSIEKKKKHIHTMMAGAIMEFMILGEVTGGENDLEIAEAQCELFGSILKQ